MRSNIKSIALHATTVTLLLFFLAACSKTATPTEKKKVPEFNIAIGTKRYVGSMISAGAPQGIGYYFQDISNKGVGNFDYLVFAKAVNKDTSATAFAQSYQLEHLHFGNIYLGNPYADLNAEQALNVAVVNAFMKDHYKRIVDLKHETSDIEIAGTICKRIDFSGKYRDKYSSNFDISGKSKKKTLPLIVGYDIHCVHPEWLHSTNPYLVRIGANYIHSAEDQQNVLPAELESFYQNVEFLMHSKE